LKSYFIETITTIIPFSHKPFVFPFLMM